MSVRTAAEEVQRRDDEYRENISRSLSDLALGQSAMRARQDELASHFAQIKSENSVQHGELMVRVEKLNGEAKADIAALRVEVRLALDTATKKLESKNKLVRVMAYGLIGMALVLTGAWGHALGIIKTVKDIWP